MKIGIRKLDAWFFLDKDDSLKKDILLFDSILYDVGSIDLLEKILGIFPFGKELLHRKLKEIELLERKGLTRKYDKNFFKVPDTLQQDSEFLRNANNTLSSFNKIQTLSKKYGDNTNNLRELYSEFLDLDRDGGTFQIRSQSAVANLVDHQNEYIPIIAKYPELDNASKQKSLKQDILHLILRKFPSISEDTSIEQIVEFKSDPDIKLRYFELIDFVVSISKTEYTVNEIEDKIEYLLHRYRQDLELHKLKFSTSLVETVCITSSQILESIVKFKLSDATKALFEIGKKRIELIEAEKQLKGREVSYIVKIEEQL